MLDEYEAGSSTDNLKPPQYRSISAARPSETVIPTTSVADIATPPRQRFISSQELRKEFMDFESRVHDQLEIVLDELRDSDRHREEQHVEMTCIFCSYRYNDDQSHTLLANSFSMS
ncbi:hypothetical protein QYF36_026064 [Acer negundo]|nr:hypothetical protein QYF36_026064 [Acer negundo]